MSREDANTYASWLNSKIGTSIGVHPRGRGGYRLPTWEEAEYAGRVGSANKFYWGAYPARSNANYGREHCFPCTGPTGGRDHWRFTSPVGSFPANAFGLYDMAGDVWQWTSTCWPLHFGTGKCEYYGTRGWSWLDNSEYLRTSEFHVYDEQNRNTSTGFRVVKALY